MTGIRAAVLATTLSLGLGAAAQVNTVAVSDDPQVKDELFEGLGLEKLAAKAKESNEVSLDKNMLALAGGKKQGGSMAGKMDLVNVRNYEFAKDGEYSLADLDALRKKLDSSGWSHLVRNRSEKEVNDVCVRTDNEGQITEMVILNAEPRELNLVHLKGKLNMNDLKKFGAGTDTDDDGPKVKHR